MSWQKGTLADWMGDFIVYRNLQPAHPQVPGLCAVWQQAGLDHYYVPRKTTTEYADALVLMLREAQRVRGVAAPLERVLFIGDTLMNDGTAAQNVGRHWHTLGFIGADRLQQEAKVELQGCLMVANRWRALTEFVEWARREGIPGDERTALLIDLDKTLLGARGRNDKVIDNARVQAVERTMRAALGDQFDAGAFRAVYDRLNQPEYHHFTADNQDYLAYICLMVNGGIYPPDELWAGLARGELADVMQFAQACEARRGSMSPGLLAVQDEVRRGIEAEDPTPFKGFRRGEYLETVARMDVLPDDAPEAEVLRDEITITAEVVSVARYMAERGALVFGLSDKPDEASTPTPEYVAQGYQPIHRTAMKIAGEWLL
ncbi:MAG: hypothetical protein GX552_04575 [Chloroflexi bacterium]|jgi:FMN phosphatase YigB (HAD superfamily)|nr:hypothetical protein [Chloroflexota bacterium]